MPKACAFLCVHAAGPLGVNAWTVFTRCRGKLRSNLFYGACYNISMYKVYVLENQNDNSWYIGQTEDLERRLKQHNSGNGGRTTKIIKGVWKLIYAEAYCDKRDAIGREKFLKSGSGRMYLKKQMNNYLETH